MTTRSLTSSTPLQCLVCQENADSVHFGAQSCRACAAFFRRKVAANQKIKQNCEGTCSLNDQVLRRFCAFCRFEKCRKVGMNPTMVLSKGPVPDSSTSILSHLKECYDRLQSARALAFGMNEKGKCLNYQEIRDFHVVDLQLILDNLLPFFNSKSGKLGEDRKVLDKNFIVPFLLLESAVRSQNSEHLIFPSGDFIDTSDLANFYHNPDDPDDLKAKHAESLMKPYWTMNDTVLRQQLREVQMEVEELLLLTAFIYWDSGIAQLSERSVDICKTKRSQIVGELTSYEKQKRMSTRDDSLRVGQVMMVLQAVQRNVDLMYECREIALVYDLDGRACPLFDNL